MLGIIRIGHELVGPVTEWDIRTWCGQAGFPVGQHFKVAVSLLSQIGTRPDMTIDVARTSNKQTKRAEQLTSLPSISSIRLFEVS